MKTRRIFSTGFALAFILSLSLAALADDGATLPNYLPIPSAVKARILSVDPQKGYVVKEIKPHVYMITDGGYQSLFVTTGSGVILLDAPPSFGSKIVQAVGEVTKEPIKEPSQCSLVRHRRLVSRPPVDAQRRGKRASVTKPWPHLSQLHR